MFWQELDDQWFQRFRQRENLGRAFNLQPLAKEAVFKDAKRSAGVAAQVAYFVSGFTGADDSKPIGIYADQNGGHLETAVLPKRRQHCPVILANKRFCFVNIHSLSSRRDGVGIYENPRKTRATTCQEAQLPPNVHICAQRQVRGVPLNTGQRQQTDALGLHHRLLKLVAVYYRAVVGEHPDWADYRQAMVREQRVLIRLRIERPGPDKSG